MDLWAIFVGLILGIVEGLSEFAPISSTGHMIIVDDILLNSKKTFGEEVANTFKVVIQLGSILAVVIIFWERILNILGLKKIPTSSTGNLSIGHILVALIPAALLGILLEDFIDEHLFSATTVLIGLVLGGVLMIVAEKIQPKVVSENLDQITYRQALGIGLFQCLALWPGFSRSGSTISGGLLFGANHRTASEFSFIVAIPVMLGASTLKIVKSWEYLTWDVFPLFAVGFVTAFIVALIAIKFFLKLISTVKLAPFAYYRFILAAIILLVMTVL